MPHKEKCSIPTLDPRASYEVKARYYERYSTQELAMWKKSARADTRDKLKP
jgi:hypothetical protein